MNYRRGLSNIEQQEERLRKSEQFTVPSDQIS